jgi:hypothetical protein
MSIEAVAAALTIIATIVSTTMIVVNKMTKLEVLIAELRVQVAAFETRIARLERAEESNNG